MANFERIAVGVVVTEPSVAVAFVDTAEWAPAEGQAVVDIAVAFADYIAAVVVVVGVV